MSKTNNDIKKSGSFLAPKGKMRVGKIFLVLGVIGLVVFVAAAILYAIMSAQQAKLVSDLKQSSGSMTYSLDSPRAKTVHADPASTANVSVSDAKGYVWTLTVPAGALVTTADITMTPFSSVTGSASAPLSSGVQFTPDGMTFLKPVSVSVVAPDDSKLQVYTSKQNGSQMSYAQMTDTSTAQLYHFSNAGAGQPQDAMSVFHDRLNQVSAFLQTNNPSLPTPPNITLHCITSTALDPNTPGLRSYITSALDPERTIVTDLLAVEARAQKEGDVTQQDTATVQSDISRLLNRIVTRLTGAVTANRGNENAFAALGSTALAVSTELQGLTSQTSAPLLNVVGKWALELATKSVQDVASQHAYSNFSEIAFLLTASHQLGVDTSSIYDLFTKAFTFTLSISESWVWSPGGQNVAASGDVKLTPTSGAKDSLGWQGTGSMSYTAGAIPPGVITGSPTIKPTITMDMLNMCTSPTLKLTQDRFGVPEAEDVDGVYVAGDPSDNGFLSSAILGDLVKNFLNHGQLQPSGDYGGVATIPAHDKAVTIADQTFSGPNPLFGGTATLKYTLKHTPAN